MKGTKPKKAKMIYANLYDGATYSRGIVIEGMMGVGKSLNFDERQ
jgi:hypothetical protein